MSNNPASKKLVLPANEIELQLKIESLTQVNKSWSKMLNAALILFSEYGIAQTTMEQIAERADVSRMWLYKTFGNKSGLVRAVVDMEMNNFFFNLNSHLAQIPNGTELILEAFALTVKFLRGHALLQRLLDSEPETLLPMLTIDAKEMVARGIELMTPWLVVRGDVKKEKAQLVAEVLVRLLTTTVIMPKGEIDLDDTNEIKNWLRNSINFS